MRPILGFGALVVVAVLASSAWTTATAQVDVTLDASPKEVQAGQILTLVVRASVKGGSFEELTFKDLKKYPELEVISHQTSRPMQVSFGFGTGMKVESSLAHQYAIRALAPGTYEFSPAVAKVDGKTYRSDPLTIVVLPATGSNGTAQVAPPAAPEADEELSGANYDPKAFLRTLVEPKEVYIGEQVDVKVYLYTRLDVSGRSVNPTKPSMDGFWVDDEPITALDGALSTVNGIRYRTYVIQSSAAFPQRTGELTIGAPKVTFETGRGFFDAAEQVERVGVPVTVTVKPLPQPGPPDAFVGHCSMRSWLDRPTVETGNAVTLRIEGTCVGNIQNLHITPPPITGVRMLQPVITDTKRIFPNGIGGKRSWEWILIPEIPGEHTVPGLEIDYFDPETGQYGATKTELLKFTSTGAAVPSQPTVAPIKETKERGEATFGPIRMYSALTRGEAPVRQRTWFAWSLALPPFIFLCLIVVVGIRRRQAHGKATASAMQRSLLEEARAALRQNDPRKFYDRIVATITHVLETHTDEGVRGLSNVELRARLVADSFDDDLVQRVINELEGADFARFAASGVDAAEMERCLERTETIVERIRRKRAGT